MPFPQYKVIELSTLSIPSEKLTLLAAMTEIFLFLSFLIAFIFKSSVSAANPIEKHYIFLKLFLIYLHCVLILYLKYLLFYFISR